LATKVVLCPECSQLVAYGRLSCTSCGALLASVVGAARSARPTVVPGLPERPTLVPDDELDDEVAEQEIDGPTIEPKPDEGPETSSHWVDEGPFEHDPGDPMPGEAQWPVPAAARRVLEEAVAAEARKPLARPSIGAWRTFDGPVVAARDSDVAAPAFTAPAFADPDHPSQEDDQPMSDQEANAPLRPSAILGPTGTLPTEAPASASAPAWQMTARPPAGELKPGQAPLLADLPFDAPATLAGWMIAVGSALGAVGFLLPWADRISLAPASATGYFASWGLAGPGYGFVFAAAVASAMLALVSTRVPAWVRDRALAPILGGALLGLAWPYLLGPIRPQLGVLVITLAGVLLLAGVVLGQRPSRSPAATERHEGAGPSV
jgi:hypothetical protein